MFLPFDWSLTILFVSGALLPHTVVSDSMENGSGMSPLNISSDTITRSTTLITPSFTTTSITVLPTSLSTFSVTMTVIAPSTISVPTPLPTDSPSSTMTVVTPSTISVPTPLPTISSSSASSSTTSTQSTKMLTSTGSGAPMPGKEDESSLEDYLIYTIIGLGAAIIVLFVVLLLCCCLCCTTGHKKVKKKVKFTDPEEGGVELVGVKDKENEDGEQTQTSDSSEAKGGATDGAEKPVESVERRGSDEKITLLTFGHQEGGEGSDVEDGVKKEGEEANNEGEKGEGKGDDTPLAKEDKKDDSDILGGDSAGREKATVFEENISKQDVKDSVDKEDKENVGAKDTDVQDNTTSSSITKTSPESKQQSDASMSVEGVGQTSSKSKTALEGNSKEPPEVVPPPQQLEGTKVEPSGASDDGAQQNVKEDDKTSPSQATATSDDTPSVTEKTSEGASKVDGAETGKTEPLSFADIEKSLGIALEGLGQF